MTAPLSTTEATPPGFLFAFYPRPGPHPLARLAAVVVVVAALAGLGALGVAALANGRLFVQASTAITISLMGLAGLLYWARRSKGTSRWAREMLARGEPSVSFDGEALWITDKDSSVCVLRENLSEVRNFGSQCVLVCVHDASRLLEHLSPAQRKLHDALGRNGIPGAVCAITPHQVSGKLREVERAIRSILDTP
jgi:hypothetical protein